MATHYLIPDVPILTVNESLTIQFGLELMVSLRAVSDYANLLNRAH
jgi:hypothetical protein